MKVLTLILLSLVAFVITKAQSPLGFDELFKAARHAAFEEKNDNRAKMLAKEALALAPLNADIQVFLGRLYSWNKNYDSAASCFKEVLGYAPTNEEAITAYTDLEYWNAHYTNALAVCNSGLLLNPTSSELLLRKARILNALKQYQEASQITNRLLKVNSRNTDALSLASSLSNAGTANRLGVSYDYSSFDNKLTQPWHLASFGYSRYSKMGSVSASLNYANRFGNSGWQAELDAYPHISKTFYGYASFGFSPGNRVFPKYRAGISLYANLPKSYEAEAGLRYMNFGTSTYVYTLYLGKYYSNFLFGGRTYVTPGTVGASQSYTLLTRYYLKSADDYIGVTIGTGISPDDKSINIQYNSKSKFSSRQAALAFNHRIGKMNILSFRSAWLNQEYSNQTSNQLTISIGLQRRF